jgi:hypothetical protein
MGTSDFRSDAPVSHGCNEDTKVFLYYIIYVIYLKTFLFNQSIH